MNRFRKGDAVSPLSILEDTRLSSDKVYVVAEADKDWIYFDNIFWVGEPGKILGFNPHFFMLANGLTRAIKRVYNGGKQ